MTMNERNFLLSSIASMPAMIMAMETQTLITIVSAIVLPMFFFCVGKAVDIYVQIYLRDKNKRDK